MNCLTLLAAATLLVSGCTIDPCDDLEVTNGNCDDAGFTRLSTYYDLPSTSAASTCEWLEVKTWDSNALYLRIETDPRTARSLLARYGIGAGALSPATRDSAALPGFEGCETRLPARVPSWAPADWNTSAMVDGHQHPGRQNMGFTLDVLTSNHDGRTEVFLHVLDT